jgi:predicted membrane protein
MRPARSATNLAMALFRAMSAGVVRGMGFAARWWVRRALFSG